MRISEQALREREARLRAIFQDAPIGITLIDLGGRTIEANQKFQDMLGYSLDELRNMVFTEFISSEDRRQCLELFNALADGNRQSCHSEHRCRCKDGSFLWVRTNASLISGVEGKPNYIIVMIEDVTERMDLEEELRTFTAQIEQSNRELGQFAYFASHDLQQPLKNINGFCELLGEALNTSEDPQPREYLRFISENAKRMEQLVLDLLTYSRLDTRGNPFEQVDLNHIFADILGEIDMLICQHHVEIKAKTLPVVWADVKQMRQLFQHLIVNAVKFRSEQPCRIALSARKQDDGLWLFSVQDNGIGISPKYHERIFYMFQKLHSRQDYPGTGIGLSISKKIVERHGGTIWVESQPKQGSTFFFTLPAQRDDTGD
jgi:PAS domain S-box-containing protein